MMDIISSSQINEDTEREDPINSIYMMAHSGARGSAAQMKQLSMVNLKEVMAFLLQVSMAL